MHLLDEIDEFIFYLPARSNFSELVCFMGVANLNYNLLVIHLQVLWKAKRQLWIIRYIISGKIDLMHIT